MARDRVLQASVPCPGGGGACLAAEHVCDGVPTCARGGDEDPGFCSDWRCAPGREKCPDGGQSSVKGVILLYPRPGLQCVHQRALCRKAAWRHHRRWGWGATCHGGGADTADTCLRWMDRGNIGGYRGIQGNIGGTGGIQGAQGDIMSYCGQGEEHHLLRVGGLLGVRGGRGGGVHLRSVRV